MNFELCICSQIVYTFHSRGLDNAGKTTILKKFNGEDITTISPTLGFNIKTLEHNGYSLNIWDVGGQKSLRSYWRNYFETTDGLIWVVDSADKRRLEDCKKELHQLLQEEVRKHKRYILFIRECIFKSFNAMSSRGGGMSKILVVTLQCIALVIRRACGFQNLAGTSVYRKWA